MGNTAHPTGVSRVGTFCKGLKGMGKYFDVKTLLRFCPVLVWLGATALAAPLAAQTVTLSSRSFWIGEHPVSADQDFPFVALRDIDWIEAVLGTDPALKDAVVQIEQEGMSPEDSVAATVAGPTDREVLLGPDRLAPPFDLPGYRVYGSPVLTAKDLLYVPVDPAAGFIVSCGMRDDVEHLSVCVIFASYAPDDHIRLKARLYFPPDPATRPGYFRAVVERLREVAYCLDVTNDPVNVPLVHPTLSGCRGKPRS
jgi:hypothetical protein